LPLLPPISNEQSPLPHDASQRRIQETTLTDDISQHWGLEIHIKLLRQLRERSLVLLVLLTGLARATSDRELGLEVLELGGNRERTSTGGGKSSEEGGGEGSEGVLDGLNRRRGG